MAGRCFETRRATLSSRASRVSPHTHRLRRERRAGRRKLRRLQCQELRGRAGASRRASRRRGDLRAYARLRRWRARRRAGRPSAASRRSQRFAASLRGVKAAVNFAGGAGGDPEKRTGAPCQPERIGATFGAYGARGGVPTLWLYAPNDRYWGAAYPKQWFAKLLPEAGEKVSSSPCHRPGKMATWRSQETWKAGSRASRHSSNAQGSERGGQGEVAAVKFGGPLRRVTSEASSSGDDGAAADCCRIQSARQGHGGHRVRGSIRSLCCTYTRAQERATTTHKTKKKKKTSMHGMATVATPTWVH